MKLNIKRKISTLTALFTVALSGCYIFEELPFQQSELKRLSETAFVTEFLAIAQESAPEEARQMLEEIGEGGGDKPVYVFSDDTVVLFSEQEKGWEPIVFMKNRDHIMFCQIAEVESPELPAGITLKEEGEEEGEIEEGKARVTFPSTIVSGPEEEMRTFVLGLLSSAPKFCLAIPIDAIGTAAPTGEE